MQISFESSNRSYVHVSFGYEVTVYIPEKTFKHIERKGNSEKQQDKLAQFINHIIETMINKIL